MDENKKTLYYIVTAVVLAVLAFIMAPKRITPDAFLDQGEALFPEFTDPNEATTLEVVSFDENTGSAVPFKVTFENGIWTIPSHHNYPADAKDRLAQTAAGLIGIKKDDLRSDIVSDHELLGVVDPTDQTAPLTGRGQRIKIKKGESVLADLILGKQVEGRQNMRFVRLPEQKRVYTARVDMELSTNFEDWIERDLLNVMKHKIKKVILKDYSINERTQSVDSRDIMTLSFSDDGWKADKSSGKVVDTTKMNALLNTLDSLLIVGVRPKPEGLSANLKITRDKQSLDRNDILSLQSKGFYITRDGQLLSNEGELQFETSEGILYTLRFGEVVYGSGLAVTSGIDQFGSKEGSGQNRYMFITAEFMENYFPKVSEPKDMGFKDKPDSLITEFDRENKEQYHKFQDWQRNVENGRNLSQKLNERFADWYYVISSDGFDKLHLNRKDLLVSK